MGYVVIKGGEIVIFEAIVLLDFLWVKDSNEFFLLIGGI